MPDVTEWVIKVAGPVAPELIYYRHQDSRPGGFRMGDYAVNVLNVKIDIDGSATELLRPTEVHLRYFIREHDAGIAYL